MSLSQKFVAAGHLGRLQNKKTADYSVLADRITGSVNRWQPV